MALLWTVDEDSLLFQACLAVGLLVLVAETAFPAVFGRRVRLQRLLRAPVLPAREFQRRKRELQQEARALQHEVAAARSLSRQRRRSRASGDQEAATTGASDPEAMASRRKARRRIKHTAEPKKTQRAKDSVNGDQVDSAQRQQAFTKKRKKAERKVDVAPTESRQTSTSKGDSSVDTEARAHTFAPLKPMVLVASIDTPPKVQLRGAMRHAREPLPGSATAHEGSSARNSSERKQRLVYWENPADLFRRDSPSAAVSVAATSYSTGNATSQADGKPSAHADQSERRDPPKYRTRGETKEEEDDDFAPWPATRVHRSISVRLGVSADMDASDSPESSIASLIGARQRLNPRRRPLPAASLPEPRQPRFVPQFVAVASAEARSGVANLVLPGNARASAASRWSSRTSEDTAEEKKEEGNHVEETNSRGEDVTMVDLDTTRQAPGAGFVAEIRRQAEKRTHEQAFAPVSRLQPPLLVALPDATPKIIRRIAFDDDSIAETPAVDRASVKKRKPPPSTGLIKYGGMSDRLGI